jgi:hypothetical protein
MSDKYVNENQEDVNGEKGEEEYLVFAKNCYLCGTISFINELKQCCYHCQQLLCEGCFSNKKKDCVEKIKIIQEIEKLESIKNLFASVKYQQKKKKEKTMEISNSEPHEINIYNELLSRHQDYDQLDQPDESSDMRTTEQITEDEETFEEEKIYLENHSFEEKNRIIQQRKEESYNKIVKIFKNLSGTSASLQNSYVKEKIDLYDFQTDVEFQKLKFLEIFESLIELIVLRLDEHVWREYTHSMILDKLWKFILPEKTKLIPQCPIEKIHENSPGSIDFVLVESERYFVFEVKQYITNGLQLEKYITQIMIEMFSVHTVPKNEIIGGCLFSFDRVIFFLFVHGRFYLIKDISISTENLFEFINSIMDISLCLHHFTQKKILQEISEKIIYQ